MNLLYNDTTVEALKLALTLSVMCLGLLISMGFLLGALRLINWWEGRAARWRNRSSLLR